jgi:hypothetical protein
MMCCLSNPFRVWKQVEFCFPTGVVGVNASEDLNTLCRLLGRASFDLNMNMFKRLFNATLAKEPVVCYLYTSFTCSSFID